MKKQHLWLLAAFAAGVVLSARVRALPGGAKIPTV